jgi:hypothetical protein
MDKYLACFLQNLSFVYKCLSSDTSFLFGGGTKASLFNLLALPLQNLGTLFWVLNGLFFEYCCIPDYGTLQQREYLSYIAIFKIPFLL